MDTKPVAKFSAGQHVKYIGDDKIVYSVRIDRMQHKSLGNMRIYSGEGQPHVEHEGKWLPKGKTRIILNMREREITAWTE